MKENIKRIAGVISFIGALGWLGFVVITVINEYRGDFTEIIVLFLAICIWMAFMTYVIFTEYGFIKRRTKIVTGVISFIVALGMVCLGCLTFISDGNDSKPDTKMADPIRSFVIDGEKVSLPASEGERFIAKYPNSKEFIKFKVGSDTVGILNEEVDRFKMEYKDATPLPEYGLGEVAPVVAKVYTPADVLLFIAIICPGITTMLYVLLTKFGVTKLNEDEILKLQSRRKGLKKILIAVLCVWCFIHTFLLLKSFPVRDMEFTTNIDNVPTVIKVAPSDRFYPFTSMEGIYDKNNSTDWHIYNFDLRFYDASEYFVYIGGILFIYFLYGYLNGSKNKMINNKESYFIN